MEPLRFKVAALVFLLLLVIIGVCIFLLYPLETPEKEEPLWLSDMDEAKMKAMREYKPILVFFFAEFNDYCIKMMDETFSNETLMVFLAEEFILVKLNFNANPYWTSYYGVTTVPVTVFASPEGKKIDSVLGFRDADAFYRGALKALEEWGEK